MLRTALGLITCLVLPVLSLTVPAYPAPTAAAGTVRSVVVEGVGIATWPAYDAGTERFAVRPSGATAGQVDVTASTDDPAGTVRVDGRPVASGSTVTVSGLEPGDEINVAIDDASASTSQSWIYLPEGFPELSADSSGEGPAAGRVFLTLTSFGTPAKFEAVVDHQAVPVYVRTTVNPMDLKLQPNGHYSVARGESAALDSTFDIVELDPAFQPVASHRTVGLANTEFHDSVLLPDGGRILMAYEPNEVSGKIDSIVQEVGPGGEVLLTWNSADHMDPETDGLTTLRDYAHLNSIDVMADGNLLLSFRHTSQVMKIDRTTGDVIWRLGGVASDFVFPDDPYGGPCAQHTARELANGNIQIWDNGSTVGATTLQPMCPDPEDPTGPAVTRPLSRVVEYSLDEPAGEAHLVWEHETGEFSEFAGSAQRLGAETDDDHTLIGTADGHVLGSGADSPDVLEVTREGEVVWSLTAPGFFSYRAAKFPAPDAIDPSIVLADGIDGAVVDERDVLVADLRCTDRGGSNLASCGGDVVPGQPLDTSPGDHLVDLVAVDGAGNTTTRQVSYTAITAWQPDADIRKPDGPWRGTGIIGGPRDQSVEYTVGRSVARRTALVRIRNTGSARDRFRLTGSGSGRGFEIAYRHQGQDVTARLADGFLTPRLATGETYRLKIVLRRTATAADGTARSARLEVTSARKPARRDVVLARILAR